MLNFQWKNLTSYGPANASASQATTRFTSTATSEVFDNSIYSSNAPESLVWVGTADVNTPTAAVSASGSQVTDSGGSLLFTNSTQNNFGFVIRSVAVPATGTWTASINVDWTEVTAY